MQFPELIYSDVNRQVQIFGNPQLRIFRAAWRGLVPREVFEASHLAMIRSCVSGRYAYMLSDISEARYRKGIIVDDTEKSSLVVQFIQSGLKASAVFGTSDVISNQSHQGFVKMLEPNLDIRNFTDENAAMEWLLTCIAKENQTQTA